MKTYPKVLTIAGSDSGGGAGIQADLKTMSALGVYGMSAITAVTAQNTVGVRGIQPIAPEIVAMQIEAVMDDLSCDAVKIGMLHSRAIIETVADKLKQYVPRFIVVDPVMISTSGHKLLEDDAIACIVDDLFHTEYRRSGIFVGDENRKRNGYATSGGTTVENGLSRCIDERRTFGNRLHDRPIVHYRRNALSAHLTPHRIGKQSWYRLHPVVRHSIVSGFGKRPAACRCGGETVHFGRTGTRRGNKNRTRTWSVESLFRSATTAHNRKRDMKITVNRKETEVAENATLDTVIAQQSPAQENIAAAVNNRVIPRTEWEKTRLNEDDKITIIQAAFGG